MLEQVVIEYNNSPHTVTKFTPAYLLFGNLPFDSPIDQNTYPSLNEARTLAKTRTIEYHQKNKTRYDTKFDESKFKPGDVVIYEEFEYPNTRKLTSPYSGPYKIVNKLSEVNYEIDRENYHTKKATEVVHASKLRFYYPPEKFKLHYE